MHSGPQIELTCIAFSEMDASGALLPAAGVVVSTEVPGEVNIYDIFGRHFFLIRPVRQSQYEV